MQMLRREVPAPLPIKANQAVIAIMAAQKYLELAKTVHYEASSITELKKLGQAEMLRAKLLAAGINIYPNEKVYAYMDYITPWSKRWLWTSLDARSVNNLRHNYWNVEKGRVHKRDRKRLLPLHMCSKHFLPPVYQKPLPFGALQAMERVQKASKQKEDLEFFVTDHYSLTRFTPAIRPPRAIDPFLAVRLHGTATLFVIHKWDEPQYDLMDAQLLLNAENGEANEEEFEETLEIEKVDSMFFRSRV